MAHYKVLNPMLNAVAVLENGGRGPRDTKMPVQDERYVELTDEQYKALDPMHKKQITRMASKDRAHG